MVGKGLSHGEEVMRPEWNGEEGSVLTLTARTLPAICSSALASGPRKDESFLSRVRSGR